MAANPEPSNAWSASPLTKFRIPRMRRETVSRPALLERLRLSAETCPITLVCAPAGSGKTTLLTQLALSASPDVAFQWIGIDEDDNDGHHLFASLLRAVEPLGLAWETKPATLLANAAGSESQTRAALAVFVNALCTAQARRIVMVLDDLHRLDSPGVFALLESLIERLPDHVALVIGSRVEPSLPLARWRAHGELAEFVPWDLQFSEAEAAALATARLGRTLDPRVIRDAVRRMNGWAAGLTLILQSGGRASLGAPSGPSDSVDRHLFAYLAQEIMADLPEDIREFILQCSVLHELSPAACQVVSGRADAQLILVALNRRNLFVTVTDDSVPVLRFHDLFRDFLESELERLYPERVRALHERAGQAEQCLSRAIAHFVRAESWKEAVALITAHGEEMLAEGSHAALERWIDQIPEGIRRSDARLCYLRGICAWWRWDWQRARRELDLAVAGLTPPEDAALRVRALFLQVDTLISCGEPELSWATLDEISRQPLDHLSRAQLALQRAWCVVPKSDPAAVGKYLLEFLEHAERDPATICPQTADRIHCLCIGLPRVAECFERYFALSELVRSGSTAPWQLAAVAVGAWGHFWRGRREPVLQLLERGDSLYHQFGSIRLVAERLLQFRALFNLASGQYDAAEALIKQVIGAMAVQEAAAHRAVWLRGYQHALARLYWMTRNDGSFRSLAPTLLAPRMATEWPFIDTAIELVRGQLAILRQDWATAEAALDKAIQLHASFRLPMSFGDPRITLAYSHLLRGAGAAAWNVFAPVFNEVVAEQAVGLLLLEPPHVIDGLFDVAPADVRRTPGFESLTAKLALWRPVQQQDRPRTGLPVTGPLAGLSDREREVLAQVASGASNKHIARDLALSLHTVKRHIANILDKLDCASRGQAADLFRRARSG